MATDAELEEQFNLFDTEGSGSISAANVSAVLVSLESRQRVTSTSAHAFSRNF